MSTPATIVILEHQPNPALRKSIEAPERLIVSVQSPSLARHALGTMVVALWICDLGTPGLDVQSLVSIAQYASPNIQILFTGTQLLAKKAEHLIAKGHGHQFIARPYKTLEIRKVVTDALITYQRRIGGKHLPIRVKSRSANGEGGANAVTQPVMNRSEAEALMHRGGVDPAHYALVELIGIGGTGSVFLAQDRFLGIEVAIKLINQNLLSDDDVLASFKDEARIAMQLSHHGILRTYSFSSFNDSYYIVMELVRGQTLRDVILENQRLSVVTVCGILVACADVLDYAHSKNVIHNDLKPENMFITESSEFKIIDFGTATLKNRAKALNHIVGTPEYMSPEQRRGDICGPETDIYALAIITYLMLLGQFPFPANTDTEAFLQGVQPDFGVLPEPLVAVLDKATAWDALDRYHTVGDFVKDFVEVCGLRLVDFDTRQPLIIQSGAEADATIAASEHADVLDGRTNVS